MSDPVGNVFLGRWTYRSFRNEPTLDPASPGGCAPDPDHPGQCTNNLLFGAATIEIVDAPPEQLRGTLGGEGWSLELHGSRSYGNPMTVRFEGKGKISGHPWIYAYVGYLVPEWPNGVDQATAMAGSIVRVIPHPGSDGRIHPAGVVASWYAVKQGM